MGLGAVVKLTTSRAVDSAAIISIGLEADWVRSRWVAMWAVLGATWAEKGASVGGLSAALFPCHPTRCTRTELALRKGEIGGLFKNRTQQPLWICAGVLLDGRASIAYRLRMSFETHRNSPIVPSDAIAPSTKWNTRSETEASLPSNGPQRHCI